MKNIKKTFIKSKLFAVFALDFLLIAIISAIYFYVVLKWKTAFFIAYFIKTIFAFFVLSKKISGVYKLYWSVFIILLPSIGIPSYFIFAKKNKSKIFGKSSLGINRVLLQNEETLNQTKKTELFGKIAKSVGERLGYPVFYLQEATYLPTGEIFFKTLCEQLKKAEKFIFLEYFIISCGKMWGEILYILNEKAKNGVEIKLIFDDFGSALHIPKNYSHTLANMGIENFAFNETHFLSRGINNRDHRKITVIDGKIAFTGGINISDEYIGEKRLFGYWKDCAVMLSGECVKSFTMMFLQVWNTKYIVNNYDNYIVENISPPCNNFVLPFSDSPVYGANAIRKIYTSILYGAKKYVYMTTPYLACDEEFFNALTAARDGGTEIRIYLPHTPDKKNIFYLTKSYYKELKSIGVKIYEYLPGFLHAKTLLCDDKISIVGTGNLDYRSMYLHFESGAAIYSNKFAGELKKDFDIMTEQSTEITEEKFKKNTIRKIKERILRIFAPLI